MTFKREIQPECYRTGMKLTADLIGIGFRLVGKAKKNPNIENTLIAASLEGLESKDGRVLSLLVDWLEIHHERINADRLINLLLEFGKSKNENLLRFWCAIFQWLKADPRFYRLRELFNPNDNKLDYLGERTDFLIKKNGEDERFKETCLKVPDKVFRHRPDDILTPKELARTHLPYRYRIIMGPSYRADMWALLKKKPMAIPAEIARKTYGSYPTAHAVKKDFEITRHQKFNKAA